MKLLCNMVVYCCCLFFFIFTFIGQELHITQFDKKTSYVPAEFLQVTLGYVTELAAGIIFAKSAVFIGDRKTTLANNTNLDSLANSLEVTARLYPELIDTYYLCEAILPPASYEYSRKANLILDFGIKSLPDQLVLSFYKGVNLFYYMKEPLAASKVFARIALTPDAPPLFEHLAAVLAAEGGEWEISIKSLQLMIIFEQNETTRKLYQKEINILKEAISIQQAIDNYIQDHKKYPVSLTSLFPNYLDKLPVEHTLFHFVYDPPKLELVRPVPGNMIY